MNSRCSLFKKVADDKQMVDRLSHEDNEDVQQTISRCSTAEKVADAQQKVARISQDDCKHIDWKRRELKYYSAHQFPNNTNSVCSEKAFDATMSNKGVDVQSCTNMLTIHVRNTNFGNETTDYHTDIPITADVQNIAGISGIEKTSAPKSQVDTTTMMGGWKKVGFITRPCSVEEWSLREEKLQVYHENQLKKGPQKRPQKSLAEDFVAALFPEQVFQ